MDADHKIQVKIGGAEFVAEGSEQAVQDQFKAFLAVMEKVGNALPAAPTPATNSPPANNHNPGLRDQGGQPNAVDDALLARVFKQDDKGVVSLRALPRGENQTADALLLLLYGYAILRKETDVSIIQLGKAAKQSGCSFDRADRVLTTSGYMDLVTKAGTRSGGKYGLNNRGTLKAEEILSAILR